MGAERRRIAIGLVLGCLAGAACDSDTIDNPAPLVVALRLENAAGEDTDEFTQGEPVVYAVTVISNLDMDQGLVFQTTQRTDYLALDGGGAAVWRWGEGRSFGQTLTTVILSPGDTLSFRTSWNQIDSAGQAVEPGLYFGQALLPASSGEIFSNRVRFTIR